MRVEAEKFQRVLLGEERIIKACYENPLPINFPAVSTACLERVESPLS